MADENKSEDDISKKLDSVDNWLTKGGNIWKKHWGKLIIIGFVAGSYYFMKWAMSLPDEPIKTEEVKQDVWTFDLGEQGDTIWFLNDTLYEIK
jgi:hypothetical protein